MGLQKLFVNLPKFEKRMKRQNINTHTFNMATGPVHNKQQRMDIIENTMRRGITKNTTGRSYAQVVRDDNKSLQWRRKDEVWKGSKQLQWPKTQDGEV